MLNSLKIFCFREIIHFFLFFFLVIFALLIRIGVQIFVDFLRRCSVIFFSSICRFQSFRIVLFSLCVFLMIMVWRTHYSQWTTHIGCIAMHLRGITACISSVSLSVESFILNVLTTPRKMIPIKKLLLGSYGRSLETMIIWDRNQCFRQINREIRKYLYLLRLLRKLGNLRVTLCTCVI